MNYRPGVDDKPTFFFKGDSEYSSKVKSDLLSRTMPIPKKKTEKKVVLDISQDEEGDEFDDDQEEGKKKPRYQKAVTSVPQKYLEPVRPGEDIDHSLQFVSSIKRGQVEENPDYSFQNFTEK